MKTPLHEYMGIARSGSWAPDISHWFPSGTDGQAEGRTYGHVITLISGMDRLPNSLRFGVTLERTSPAHGAPLRNVKLL